MYRMYCKYMLYTRGLIIYMHDLVLKFKSLFFQKK
jgi:hypothetical protein